ncbi:MAG: PHP domain-containing protein [Clostridia bacterium]|nr:PHP domain-containing protein [Clostridia bacterium]MBQ4158069.1 PHP domain-containing protein [Clostridia bacterium]
MNARDFYVQMHLHTSETSRCGKASGKDIAAACKEAGYSLIAITDHFFNANIGCERNIPWEEKVEYLFRGYYSAKKEGDRLGLIVIRGWETFQNGRELLTYGLDEDFLLKNKDIDQVSYYEYIKLVNEAGGKIVHAHPYRRAGYIPEFEPDPKSVEAYEVYNAGNGDDAWNEKALNAAKENGLLEFSGSDAHRTESVRGGAMKIMHPVYTINEIFEAVRNGESEIIKWLE